MPCGQLYFALLAIVCVASSGCAGQGARSIEAPGYPEYNAPGAPNAGTSPPRSGSVSTPAVTDGLAQSSATATDAPVIRQQDSTDENDGWDWDSVLELTPTKVFDSVRQKTPWRRDEEKGTRLYREGEDLYSQGKFGEAGKKFKSAAWTWPDSPLEEDALFMLGECYFFGDRYPKANDTWSEMLKKYEYSRHLDKIVNRQFAIARYWLDLQQSNPRNFLNPNLLDNSRPIFDTSGNALATYESIRLNDPTGDLADDSIMATANAHFLNDRYNDSDYYYGLLRSEYPQSDHLIQAYLLGLRSKLRTYQGAQYDPTPIEDSEELIDQMLTQLPQQIEGERDRLLQVKAEVRSQKAQRDWKMAEFYYKNSYYGAVRHYCEKILREYPDTPLANDAHNRLDEIKGYPDTPPQRLKWLVDLIPSSDRFPIPK